MQNFLNTLGLPPGKNYTPEEIKKAWKLKCNEHHPDKGGDQQVFLLIMHSYKMLTDPEYRREEGESKRGRKGDLNIRMQMPISFEDAFFGREIVITYNQLEMDQEHRGIFKTHQDLVTLVLQIPAGCQNGRETTVAGKGLKCGEEVGDVYAQFVIQPHNRFQMAGADVVVQESIPLDTVLQGGEVEVQTMYGLKTLKVPPGTRPGDKLEMKKCGVNKQGKHIVVVDAVYPSQEELKKKDAWKKLDINWAEHPEEKSEEEKLEESFRKMGGGFKFEYDFGTGMYR